MGDVADYTPPSWPPAEWASTDQELEANHVMWLQDQQGVGEFKATREGKFVFLSVTLHEEDVVEFLDQWARWVDHQCDDAAEAIAEMQDALGGVLVEATAYEGDLVADECEYSRDAEEDDA